MYGIPGSVRGHKSSGLQTVCGMPISFESGFFFFFFWLMEYFKTQDISHKNPEFQLLLKTWTIWPSCKHLHMCACAPQSLLPIDASFPGAPSLLDRLQVCPWRDSKVAWEGSCADMFPVKGEAGAGARALASPGSSSFSNQRGQRGLWALPRALCLCGWRLPAEDGFKDGSQTEWLFLSIRFCVLKMPQLHSSKMVKNDLLRKYH